MKRTTLILMSPVRIKCHLVALFVAVGFFACATQQGDQQGQQSKTQDMFETSNSQGQSQAQKNQGNKSNVTGGANGNYEAANDSNSSNSSHSSNSSNSAAINNAVTDEPFPASNSESMAKAVNAPVNSSGGLLGGPVPSANGLQASQNLAVKNNAGATPPAANGSTATSTTTESNQAFANVVDEPIPGQYTDSAHGVVNWVGYNYKKTDKVLEVQIVVEGNPAYKLFQETNKSKQQELVIRYLNSSLRKKIRRDINATEFRSPVAYIRMRQNDSYHHTDVILTMREAVQPFIATKGSNLMLTFKLSDRWFAPASKENPVAEAKIVKDENEAASSEESAPVEKKTAVYVDNPGADTFEKKSMDSVPLVPKSESSPELVPQSSPQKKESLPPKGDKLLFDDSIQIQEIWSTVNMVAQGDFSADIPTSNSALLEDAPLPAETATATPINAPANSGDVMGVNAGANVVQSSKKVVRLDFRDAPISQIIRMIAGESGINFIISPEAGSKKTSISLKNVPWDVALKALLESNRLGMQEIAPGLVRIDYLKTFTDDRDAEERAQQATEALVPTKVLVMPMSYAKADEAAKMALAMLPKPTDPGNVAQRRNYDRFKVQADVRSNSVIVEATPAVLSTVKILLERLDQQTPQVRIASRLVEMTNDFTTGLGIQWGTPFSYDPGRGLGFGTLPFPNYVTSSFAVDPWGAGDAGAKAAFKFGSINNVVALDLTLRMYETKRQAETLQTQDVVVQDNEKATVTAGTVDYFVTSAGVGSSGSLAQVDYNLSLNVTPHITADGAVQMKLDIRGDSANPSVASASSAASKNTRQLTTTLLKRSGETAVIGGLYSSDTNKIQRGIPILSDIPLFGALFRSTEKKDSKKDLLIMVTPSIVGSSAANASSSGGDAAAPSFPDAVTTAARERMEKAGGDGASSKSEGNAASQSNSKSNSVPSASNSGADNGGNQSTNVPSSNQEASKTGASQSNGLD